MKKEAMKMDTGMDAKMDSNKGGGMGMGMMSGEAGPERIYAFSDGVFAIIITIMVLDLKRPEVPTFPALLQLWPTWLAYGVSYLFIAVVWINHHFLMKFAQLAKLTLIWANFTHLFCVSLIPFLTSWLSESRLAPIPVAMYAFDFILVNLTYLWLVWETLCDDMGKGIPERTRSLVHLRCFLTLGLFTIAMILAFWWPLVGFGLILCCLVLYTRPDVPQKLKIGSMMRQRPMHPNTKTA